MKSALSEALTDEIATLKVLNKTLAQPNLHDGPRAEAQKARGICIANLRRIVALAAERTNAPRGRKQESNASHSRTA